MSGKVQMFSQDEKNSTAVTAEVAEQDNEISERKKAKQINLFDKTYNDSGENLKEKETDGNVSKTKNYNIDVSLRTFQFINGNNLTAFGAGFTKNYKKTTAFISPLVGYDFANKKPWVGAFGFVDRKYKDKTDKKVWISQELYGEITKEKGLFDSKLTYTPLKVNVNLSKNINLSFTPRAAVHMNENGFTPQMETLTTLSGPLYKNLSGYVLFQTYDTTNLFKKGTQDNVGINGGIVYTF